MGENWSQRSVELKSWTLVLCPPDNTTLPPQLDVRMAQQALDLGLSGSNALRGAFRGLASADRLQALSGGSLLPARGTPTSPIINAAATTTFSSYSDVADAGVAALVRGIDNIQTLYGLPYTPPPLITVWLPWVELVLGGTELVLENFIWPGKIVNYALSIEVAVRTREAMTAGGGTPVAPAGGGANSGGGSLGVGAGPAPVAGISAGDVLSGTAPVTGTTGTATDGTGGSGTGTDGTSGSGSGSGSGDGSGSGSASGGGGEQEGCDDGTDDSNNPKGIIVGPNGPVTVDKQLLLDTFCSMSVPGYDWLFSRTPDNATTNGTAIATVPTTTTDVAADMRSSSPVSDLPFGNSPAAFAALTGLGARSPVVQPPTVASLEPLDFVPAPADGEWLDQPPFQGVFPQVSRRPGRQPAASAPSPNPDALTAILDDMAQSLTAAAYNEELQKGLQLLSDQAAAASSALGAVASNPQLQQRGGPNAVMAAQALQAGAQTYQDVLQASQDSLKRMSMQDMVNKTQKFLKDGGMKDMMNSGAGDRFIWNLNKVQLRFQFQAQDGLRTTYQQYLYQVSDVNQIQTLAEELAAMDEVANGSHNKTKNGKDDKGNKENGDKGKGDHRRRRDLLGATDGEVEDEEGAPKPKRDKDGKPLLPTGETVAVFMARITAEAEATAARAFKRLDLSSTTGLDRIVSV